MIDYQPLPYDTIKREQCLYCSSTLHDHNAVFNKHLKRPLSCSLAGFLFAWITVAGIGLWVLLWVTGGCCYTWSRKVLIPPEHVLVSSAFLFKPAIVAYIVYLFKQCNIKYVIIWIQMKKKIPTRQNRSTIECVFFS